MFVFKNERFYLALGEKGQITEQFGCPDSGEVNRLQFCIA